MLIHECGDTSNWDPIFLERLKWVPEKGEHSEVSHKKLLFSGLPQSALCTHPKPDSSTSQFD